MRHVGLGALALVTAALVLGTAGTAAAQTPSCPWMDTTKTPDARAQALLAASTLDQKLRWLDEQSANNPQHEPDSTSQSAHPVRRRVGRKRRADSSGA